MYTAEFFLTLLTRVFIMSIYGLEKSYLLITGIRYVYTNGCICVSL